MPVGKIYPRGHRKMAREKSRANQKMVDRVNQLSEGGSDLKNVYKGLFEHLKKEQVDTVSSKDVLDTQELAKRLAEKEFEISVKGSWFKCGCVRHFVVPEVEREFDVYWSRQHREARKAFFLMTIVWPFFLIFWALEFFLRSALSQANYTTDVGAMWDEIQPVAWVHFFIWVLFLIMIPLAIRQKVQSGDRGLQVFALIGVVVFRLGFVGEFIVVLILQYKDVLALVSDVHLFAATGVDGLFDSGNNDTDQCNLKSLCDVSATCFAFLATNLTNATGFHASSDSSAVAHLETTHTALCSVITGDIKFDVGGVWSLLSIMMTSFTAILFRLRHHYIIWLVFVDFTLNTVLQIFVAVLDTSNSQRLGLDSSDLYVGDALENIALYTIPALAVVWASSQYNTFLQALFISAEKQRVLNESLSTAAGTALKEKERIDRIVAAKQVMISYKHADTAMAQAIAAKLRSSGFDIWIDNKIRTGKDWRNEIAEAIQESMAIVFLVSKLSCESKYCKEEVFFARSCGVPIVPVVLEWPGDALKSGLKLILGQIQWIFLPEVESQGEKHLLKAEELYLHQTEFDEAMQKVTDTLEASRPVAQSTASSGARGRANTSSEGEAAKDRQALRSKSFAQHLLKTAESEVFDDDEADSPHAPRTLGLQDHICLLYAPADVKASKALLDQFSKYCPMLPFYDPIAATAERVSLARKAKRAAKQVKLGLGIDSKRPAAIDDTADDDDGEVDEDPEMVCLPSQLHLTPRRPR